MREETVRDIFIRWTDERPAFTLSSFFEEVQGSLHHQQMLAEILPILSECGCEIVKEEGDLVVRWKRKGQCTPGEAPAERKVDPVIQKAIENHITAKTGKSWNDPLTLSRIREAIIGQKEDYWKEGENRFIRYHSGYSVFAYLAYHFPVSFIQMRHLISELMSDRLLPERMAVLDVGCGPGTVTLALQSLLSNDSACRASVHAIEQASEFIEAYHALTRHVKNTNLTILAPETLDITDSQTPLPEGPYDLIVCANVLNEIPDTRIREKTVLRLAERLSDDGTILITEPADLANATALRNLSRRLHEEGVLIYAPCADIRGVPCMVGRCWSFIEFPDIQPTRLMNAVAATDEPFRFYNTDIKTAYAIHRKDGIKKIQYRVPNNAKAERISRLHLHEGKKINVIAQKISANIGDSSTFLYRICDGTGRREAYAALPFYHQSDNNTQLRKAAYGSVLRFDRVLVRHHKKYDAYHLLVTKESNIELLAGSILEGGEHTLRQARRETKKWCREKSRS